MKNENKLHWEKVYSERSPGQVSWTQGYPTVSMEMVAGFNLDKSAPIIDIGGGDSLLVDSLLREGYSDITVVDISARALEKAKARLGELSGRIHWIEADIRDFVPQRSYALWHDRAAFHFLLSPAEISGYAKTAAQFTGEYLVIATFSLTGPEKCSGLPVSRYSEHKLCGIFRDGFTEIECRAQAHTTPMQGKQDFLFCSFKKNTVEQETKSYYE